MQIVRRIGKGFAIATVTVAMLLFALFVVGNVMLTGKPWPMSQVDSLNHPVKVAQSDVDGLVLVDGRSVSCHSTVLSLIRPLPLPRQRATESRSTSVEMCLA